jgi:hypothetical protein
MADLRILFLVSILITSPFGKGDKGDFLQMRKHR